MLVRNWVSAIALGAMAVGAQAAGFVNGGFDDGTTNGWVIGGGSRSGQNLININPNDYLPGGLRYSAGIANGHSEIVTPGLDPQFGALMQNVVFGGTHALRVEDRTTGGFVSLASQTVTNYTDPDIFFAWQAVLENGGHSAEQSAAMIIKLTDVTTNQVLISRIYNAVGGGGGVDARFTQQGNYFYTPQWQIEQLSIDASRMGNTFELIVLASDCAPTGHEGYVYLDGFGSVAPPPGPGGNVPEPGALLLAGTALMGAIGLRRRKQAGKAA
jgi:PEP-CTERM motif